MSVKAKIISILEQSKGDDLYRAQLAFRNHTPAEMQYQYGQSGKTCQEILDGYKRHNDEIDSLIHWVNEQ